VSETRHQRKIKNFLLQPLVQIKLGLYATVVTVLFSVIMFGVLYANFYRIYDMILELTDLRTEVTMVLDSYIASLMGWLGALVLLYVSLMIVLSIYYTHRLIGPTYAFRRHIQELMNGNLSSRITLRKGDALHEVADDLNALAEYLAKK